MLEISNHVGPVGGSGDGGDDVFDLTLVEWGRASCNEICVLDLIAFSPMFCTILR